METRNKKTSVSTDNRISKGANPLYPPKKESSAKELLSAVVTAVVCLVLVGVIAKNFNVYAVEQRKREKQNPSMSESYGDEYYGDEYYGDEYYDGEYYDENYVEDDFSGETEEFIYEESAYPEEELTGDAEDEWISEEPYEESEYIFEDSDVRLISEDELWGMTAEELTYARNEIYARYGRKFKDETIQAYFNAKSWYRGMIEPDDFDHEWLNEIEKENANMILDYEKEMGYR